MNIVMPNATKKLKLEQQDPGEEPRSLDRDSPIPLKNLGNTCYENSIIQCLFSLNMFMDNFENSMKTVRKHVVKQDSKTFDLTTFNCNQVEQQNEDKEQQKESNEEKLQQRPQHLQEQPMSSENDIKTTPIITEKDVRFRIADAFDNLYRSYTKKRIQIETNNQIKLESNSLTKNDHEFNHQNVDQQTISTNAIGAEGTIITTPVVTTSTSTDLAINDPQEAIPLCKPTTASDMGFQLSRDEKVDPIESSVSATSTSTSNTTPIALMSTSSAANQNEQSEIETRLENLKSAVGERSNQFNSSHQQDASEFFYHVIDSIQEFYQSLEKSNDDDNPVTKAFELELDYLIRCPKCRHQTLSEPEKIRTLPLALPHINNNTVIESNETTATTNNPKQSTTTLLNQSNGFNHETNGAPTPPTSDLGLDSPESSTFEEQKNGSDEKENQALIEDEEMRCDENNSNNTTVSSNTMSIAKLDLTDDLETKSDKQNEVQILDSQNQPQQLEKQSEHKSLDNINQLPTTQIESQPPKQYTLNDALNNYFKDDVLECNCSQANCDSKRKTKKCLIRKLPQVLFITLARYSYTGKKNLDEIEAPFELIVPFRENRSPSHSPSAYTRLDDENSNKYQLVAVVCHHGSSLNAGHYTSYVFNQNNSSWYSCDDDSITRVQEADVKSDATKSGYCFFYAHNSCISKKPQTNIEQIILPQTEFNQNQAIVASNNSVVDSSVILTPESSPKSSPSPSIKISDDTQFDHTCCNDNNYIDDWS